MNQEYVFLTFGAPTTNFHLRALQLSNEARTLQFFTQIHAFTENDLKNDANFWEKHKYFMERSTRGYGFWLWKPYLIQRTLNEYSENDIIIYADAGCTINHKGMEKLYEYKKKLEENTFGMIVFELKDLPEIQFTKSIVLDALVPLSQRMTNQMMATIVMIRNTKYTRDFTSLWYDLACNYNLINDTIRDEDEMFIEHRHDQSIFSALVKQAIEDKISPSPLIIPDETFFYPNWEDGDNYPFWATRIRNQESGIRNHFSRTLPFLSQDS
jgi:hypothetical protein